MSTGYHLRDIPLIVINARLFGYTSIIPPLWYVTMSYVPSQYMAISTHTIPTYDLISQLLYL